MRLLTFLNKTGSRYYRLLPQLEYMAKQGHEIITREWNNKIDAREMKWADVVILEMVSGVDINDMLHKYGCKVILEYDDLVEKVPKLHPNYPNLKGKKGRKKWRAVKKAIKSADAIITVSPELYHNYGKYTKHKLLFPNYCWINHWEKPYKPNDSEQLRLLWAGSTSHKADLIPFKPTLKKILLNFPEIKFIYIGTGGASSSNPTTELFYGEDFFKDFPENREYMIGVDSAVWPFKLSTLRADIGLAPLEKNYFNKCKSLCKYLEYSINKIPAIYSRWFYKKIVKDNQTGLLADTPEEWYQAIKALIMKPDMRKRLAEAAYKDVKENYNIKSYLPEWENFVKTLKEH